VEPFTGLYVHVPFCVHKCGYCDFNSWAESTRPPQERWLEALRRQVAHWAGAWGGDRVIDTVFFGGGTPSLLANDLLKDACEVLRDSFAIAPSVEWTFECNPETVNEAKLEALAAAGVNRISVGIQSFRDQDLVRLERSARRADNLRVLELVSKRWSGRWSLDLMFGLPEQTGADWEDQLSTGLAFGPDHVSAYQLTLTTARSRAWAQPDEDRLLEMFDRTEALLATAGLPKYETSNFARPSQESRHNLRYWRLEPFLGLGPGAAGLLTGQLSGQPAASRFGYHQKNPDRFEDWSGNAGQPSRESLWLTPRDARAHLHEMLMMGLRLRTGIPAARLGSLSPWLQESLARDVSYLFDFIALDKGAWKVTTRGAQQLDTILAKLFALFDRIAPEDLDLAGIDPTFC
jgi:putative oxygen-independent coproporphyrinogen III oxidase